MVTKRVGVLALQGDFREHLEVLSQLGIQGAEVRETAQLDDIDSLILPGGESTAMSELLESSGLFDAIKKRLTNDSLPILGTCAGAILMANEVVDDHSRLRRFGGVDIAVRRNGIGPQKYSFEAALKVEGIESSLSATFIRPPVIEAAGEAVKVLATWGGKPVVCSQGAHLLATFHPELVGETRIHSLFLERLQ